MLVLEVIYGNAPDEHRAGPSGRLLRLRPSRSSCSRGGETVTLADVRRATTRDVPRTEVVDGPATESNEFFEREGLAHGFGQAIGPSPSLFVLGVLEEPSFGVEVLGIG